MTVTAVNCIELPFSATCLKCPILYRLRDCTFIVLLNLFFGYCYKFIVKTKIMLFTVIVGTMYRGHLTESSEKKKYYNN